MHHLPRNMEAAQPYYEEDVWEEQSGPFGDVTETNEGEQPLENHSVDVEDVTEINDEESEAESSCLQGEPQQRLQERLQLRTSEGTADLNGHGAVHEQLPVGENNTCS